LLGEDRHLTIEVVGLRLYVEFENEKAQKTYEKLGMEKTNYFIFEEEF
jgi:ribosomal protein S18 acetylase RimI-like enzyme